MAVEAPEGTRRERNKNSNRTTETKEKFQSTEISFLESLLKHFFETNLKQNKTKY